MAWAIFLLDFFYSPIGKVEVDDDCKYPAIWCWYDYYIELPYYYMDGMLSPYNRNDEE